MKTLNCSFITAGVAIITQDLVLLSKIATCISYNADSCLLSHKGITLLMLPLTYEGLAGIITRNGRHVSYALLECFACISINFRL